VAERTKEATLLAKDTTLSGEPLQNLRLPLSQPSDGDERLLDNSIEGAGHGEALLQEPRTVGACVKQSGQSGRGGDSANNGTNNGSELVVFSQPFCSLVWQQ